VGCAVWPANLLVEFTDIHKVLRLKIDGAGVTTGSNQAEQNAAECVRVFAPVSTLDDIVVRSRYSAGHLNLP